MSRWPKVLLRRLVECLDGARVPLNAEQRSAMQGETPYWGANGVVDHVDRSIFAEELVLLGEDGAPFDRVGKDVAFRIIEPVWVNNHIHVLRPIPRLVDARFLTYALNATDWMPHVTGSTRLKLTQRDMLAATIPLPSLSEQRRIADFLDSETGRMTRLIVEYERQIELVREERQSLISSAVSKPDWPRPHIRRVARMGSGHTPSRSRPDFWAGERSIPWLTTGDVARLRDGTVHVLHDSAESITEVGLANSSAVIHPAGTVAMSRTASVGFTCVMGVPMATSQDWVTWTPKANVDSRFLLWSIRGEMPRILSRKKGSTHSTIYMDELRELRASIPPIDEQRAVVEFLDAETARMDETVTEMAAQIDHLRELRRALITTAVSEGVEACA